MYTQQANEEGSFTRMSLFKKKRQDPPPEAPAWTPTVSLELARPVVFALANAPVSSDVQVRSAIASFVRLSERPSMDNPHRFAAAYLQDPECIYRPWAWLAAVMRDAAAAGDHHLAAAGLFWACHWTSELVPRNNSASFMELELDPIPAHRKIEIHRLGVASAQQLPPDFLVVGDQTGSVHAGPLAELAAKQLGI
jgi:hypothetical protein